MGTGRAFAIGAGLFGGVAAGLALYSRAQARRAEAAVPADGRFVEVEGARLHYLERGSGPAIVMVHGLAGGLRNFSYGLLDRLAEHHRVILVDRPGSGYSVAAPGRRPGIAEQGRILARFLRALELERPLLVGHSLGGAVSLALAAENPGLVRGLALLAPLTQAREDVPPAFRGLVARSSVRRAVVANVLGVPLGQLARRHTAALIFAPEPAPDDFDVRGGAMLALRPGNIDAASFEMLAASEEMAAIAARYPDLDLPVSILFGRGDRILDYRIDGEVTASQIPGARLEVIEGGHMIPVTQPDRVAAFVAAAA